MIRFRMESAPVALRKWPTLSATATCNRRSLLIRDLDQAGNVAYNSAQPSLGQPGPSSSVELRLLPLRIPTSTNRLTTLPMSKPMKQPPTIRTSIRYSSSAWIR